LHNAVPHFRKTTELAFEISLPVFAKSFTTISSFVSVRSDCSVACAGFFGAGVAASGFQPPLPCELARVLRQLQALRYHSRRLQSLSRFRVTSAFAREGTVHLPTRRSGIF
jgi:hypothetical protein